MKRRGFIKGFLGALAVAPSLIKESITPVPTLDEKPDPVVIQKMYENMNKKEDIYDIAFMMGRGSMAKAEITGLKFENQPFRR